MLTLTMPTSTAQNWIHTANLVGIKTIVSNIKELTFRVKDVFNFTPGQYVWIEIPSLLFPDPKGTRRAFSISSRPGQENIQIIVRASDSGYNKTLLGLTPGKEIKLHGPFGSFLKDDNKSQKDLVLVAGGLALAPFLSLARNIQNTPPPRKICLIHVSKIPEENIYSDELKKIVSTGIGVTYIPVVGRENKTQFEIANKELPSANWYITGPQGFVNSVLEHLKTINVDITKTFFEEHYPLDSAAQLTPDTLTTESIENTFKLAVDNAFIHFVITDINGYILYANQAAEKITGYTFSEMKGNTPRLWGGIMDLTFYKSMWTEIKNNHKSFSGKITNRRKSGEIYIAQATISPILNKNGGLIGFIGTEEDISELEQSEAQNRRLASIVDVSLDAIYSKDLSGTILTWNQGAEEMYKYNADEIIGENIEIIIPDNHKGEEKIIIERVLNGEIIKRFETQRVRKDGVVLEVELSVSPIKDDKGNMVSVSVIGRDVTQQKKEKEQTDRMNKLMVGREIRMIELKKKIKELTKNH